MKRILTVAICALSFLSSMAQSTLTGDRVIARNGIYLKDSWIDSIQKSGSVVSNRSIPTTKYLADSFIKNQIAQNQAATAWIDSLKVQSISFVTSSGLPLLKMRGWQGSFGVNIGIGDSAGGGNSNNIALGVKALKKIIGGNSIGIGNNALENIGNYWANTAVGNSSLNALISGNSNTAFGASAFSQLLSGSWNTAFGTEAGKNITSGNDDLFIGQGAGGGLSTGSGNVIIGGNTIEGAVATPMNYNTHLGFYSGRYAVGSNNVFLGYGAGYSETGSNKLHIASSISKSLIDGEFDNDRVIVNGSLSINDSSTVNQDAAKLYVSGKSKLAGDVKITGFINLAASSAPSGSSDVSGDDGDLKRDSSGNLYLKAGGQWLKFTGVTF